MASPANMLSILPIKGRILVYSITGCTHCTQAKALLKQNNLPFIDIDVDDDANIAKRKKLIAKLGTDRFTVPQIFFNDTLIGGHSELRALATEERNKDKWEQLLHELQTKSCNEDDDLPAETKTPTKSTESLDNTIFDPFAQIARDFYDSDVACVRKDGFFKRLLPTAVTGDTSASHPDAGGIFTGKEFIDWYMNYARKVGNGSKDRKSAVNVGQELLNRVFVLPTITTAEQQQQQQHSITPDFIDSDDAVYQLPLQSESTTAIDDILNAKQLDTSMQRSASEIATDLRKLVSKLYEEFVSADGKTVDYTRMEKSPQFIQYERLSEQLQRINLSTLSAPERLAFFLNIYNVLYIHWTIVHGAPASQKARMQIYSTAAYIIGGRRYTLDDIEHGMLRANRRRPYHVRKPLRSDDPRLLYAVNDADFDARIHFALNCGAKSCPPVRLYDAEKIDVQLQRVAGAFLVSEGCEIKKNNSSDDVAEIWLSKLFDWYGADFGASQHEVLQWILKHFPDDSGEKKKLDDLLRGPSGSRYKVHYAEYDWNHNGG